MQISDPVFSSKSTWCQVPQPAVKGQKNKERLTMMTKAEERTAAESGALMAKRGIRASPRRSPLILPVSSRVRKVVAWEVSRSQHGRLAVLHQRRGNFSSGQAGGVYIVQREIGRRSVPQICFVDAGSCVSLRVYFFRAYSFPTR